MISVSIPLAVRGLDLAASRERKHSVSRKEDLQVIVSLMESELEQVCMKQYISLVCCFLPGGKKPNIERRRGHRNIALGS